MYSKPQKLFQSWSNSAERILGGDEHASTQHEAKSSGNKY